MSQSVSRALQILVGLREGPQTITLLAAQLEVHPTTALRLLQTLAQDQFVLKREDGTYSLGPRIIDLGQSALEHIDLRTVARPHLERLASATGEAVHLAVLGVQEISYVDKVDSAHPVRMYSRIGLLAPLHCTGVGKALLAALTPEQRDAVLDGYTWRAFNENTLVTRESLEADLAVANARGFTIDAEEHEKGIHCIARALRSRDGSVAGSISLSAPVSRVPRRRLLSWQRELMVAVTDIEADLGVLPSV